jgi:phosphoglucosamine mutase
MPQLLRNVRVAGHDPKVLLEDEAVVAAVAEGEARLKGVGRILIRKSGTEPLIRVMAEGEDEALVDSVVADICAAVESVAREGA